MSTLLSAQEFTQKYPNVKEKQALSFIAYCQVQNNTIPESSIELASRILFNKELPTRQVPVITLRMGLGKTTLVNLYTKFMRSVDKEYGSMIAVERVETIKDIVENNPSYYGLYGFRKDECSKKLEYYNPNMCRICDDTDCRVTQNEQYVPVSPVLLITHSRLNILMQDKLALAKLMYFYDEKYEHQFRRDDLFVDECPGFFTIDHLNEKNFLIFQDSLHAVYRRDCKPRRDLINYFKGYIHSIRQELKSDYVGFFHIPSIVANKKSFTEFLMYKQRFMLNYYGAYYQLCLNVLNAIHQGGYIKNHMLTTPREHELQTGDHRTFILDGTAHINASYPQKCLIIDFPDKRVFNNVTWNIDYSHNLSKEYYHSHPNFIPEIKDFIIKQLEKHNKILIITFKELEPIYKEYFTEQQLEHIYIDHFNNLKGKNHYRDATCMFYLGTLYKGDIYYLFYYKYCKSLDGEPVELEQIDFMNVKSQRIPVHKDTLNQHKELQSLINYDQADMIVQDGFRCEPRGNETSISDYFIFCTNDELPEKISDFFPGAKIENMKIIDKKRESQQYDDFIEYIYNLPTDDSIYTIAKKKICSDLSISRQALSKYLAKTEVIKILTDRQLVIGKHYIKHI